MKKITFLILLISHSWSSPIFAQNKLTEVEKLAATAKVWGFLKYYHPKVATGKYDWDKQLFEVLPKVKSAEDKEQLSAVYIDWIASLGKVNKCSKCQKVSKHTYLGKNFDLSWMEDENVFTSELSKQLKFIENNRHLGKKHYVAAFRNSRVRFPNEKPYVDFDWKSEQIRLLSLFRYWNMIEYFFPYKYQTNTDWSEVLTNMIPLFLYPKTETDLHIAMLELISSIDDGHAFLRTPQTKAFFGEKWPAFMYRFIDENVVITGALNESFFQNDDLRVGDVITKVDGREVFDVFEERIKYISASNYARKKHNAIYHIFNGNTDSVTIEYIRDQQIYTKTIKRYAFKEMEYEKPVYAKSKLLDNNIGYVNVGDITVDDVPPIMDSFMDTKAIIFDLRNYPKGTKYEIAKYITSSRHVFYMATNPDLSYPGKFILREGYGYGNDKGPIYKGQVVVLVDEVTQSQAEHTAMLLQTGDQVTTIGRPSSGADGDMAFFEMLGGFRTGFSGVGIYYPDMTPTQRVGVKVDIEVKSTIQGIKEGRDEVLERAITFIEQSK